MNALLTEALVLASHHIGHPHPARSLSESCRAALGTSYAVGLTLAADAGLAQRVSLAADGRLAGPGEHLQVHLGQGPCVQALARERPVLAGDLDDRRTARAWPLFARRAVAEGIRAAFAFPAVHDRGTVRPTGVVLSLYGDRTGPVSDADLWTAGVHAHAADLLLLSVGRPAEDTLADTWLLPYAAVVHQAVGVISCRHALSTDRALLLLRSHADLEGVALTALSHAVVHEGRRLTGFDELRP
ncbi:GAF domain-containing protein [Streptomyces sp. CRN 30]|uniref:GAF domain-containing protein n=1 Tax=Streptomyces sp. CRN 30 TaxID=3075613 RepID=UPI002A82E4A8|nr:GAF domain-containing protein [Streptomyces sp. CRN 30]